MKRAEKVQRIAAILDELYPQPAIPLSHNDPYTLLISVLLSAQTTDKKVNEVVPSLYARAKTPRAMAALEVETIRELIKQIGLAPTKAKNIRALSEMLLEAHDGEVPADFAALEALPGVGHKTASVVMAQGFGVAAFPVDTHIHRLAARWGLSSGKNVVTTEADLKTHFPEQSWNKVHLQIIYFGREHCPARRHDMDTCPICSFAASATKKAEEVAKNAPKKKKKKKKKKPRREHF